MIVWMTDCLWVKECRFVDKKQAKKMEKKVANEIHFIHWTTPLFNINGNIIVLDGDVMVPVKYFVD